MHQKLKPLKSKTIYFKKFDVKIIVYEIHSSYVSNTRFGAIPGEV